VPAAFLATNSGLSALFKPPADIGANSSITLAIDTSTGRPTGLEGAATISGTVVLLSNGDVTVGLATLTADLVDASARAAFTEAAALGVVTTVRIDGVGSLDPQTGDVEVEITLVISFAVPTAVATPTAAPTPVPLAALLPDTAAR
jgi:hypothetical protein